MFSCILKRLNPPLTQVAIDGKRSFVFSHDEAKESAITDLFFHSKIFSEDFNDEEMKR